MKPLALAALLALAACQRPSPTDQAGAACREAGLAAGTEAYTQCFQAVLPAYVRADSSRRAIGAAMVMGRPMAIAP